MKNRRTKSQVEYDLMILLDKCDRNDPTVKRLLVYVMKVQKGAPFILNENKCYQSIMKVNWKKK